MNKINDMANVVRSSASGELDKNVLTNIPIGFEVLNEVPGQYILLKDPNGLYVIAVRISRPHHRPSSYERWVELPKHEKLLIRLFPSRLKYLVKKVLHNEKRYHMNRI